MNPALKVVPIVALLAVLPFSASAQTGWGRIGPSGAQVAGAAIGVAAVTVLVLYVTLHKPSITGCVQSVDGTTSVMEKKNNLSYTLVNANSELKSGDQVKLIGKKKKDKQGNLTFRVKKIKHDYGPCQQ